MNFDQQNEKHDYVIELAKPDGPQFHTFNGSKVNAIRRARKLGHDNRCKYVLRRNK